MTARAMATDFRMHPVPRGVEDAERLAVGPGDAALIRDLRANATHTAHYIAELEANGRAQANMLTDLQAELADIQYTPPMKLVETFNNPDTPFSEVRAVCAALRIAGAEPIMEWHGDGTAIWLTVSIADEAA